MNLVQRAVLPLRAVLVLSFALLVVFQTLSMPGQFRYMAEEHPDDADLRWPFTVIAVLVILCLQVVIVCIWHLLTMVAQNRIFTVASMRWVDVIIGAMAVGWLLVAGTLVGLAAWWDDPGVPMVLTLLLLASGSCGLLMVVMRELLKQATALRTDMDAVI